ncbi:hypothetical protein ACFDAU_08210 [Sulfuriferula sp. GW1]|uniref:hypothetical protein n=1 Tax=Sulfuriferula sp. GW1 TaxID=3345111 RepID=UPI0039B03CF8
MTKYGFEKTVDMSFDDAIVHVTQALQGEGFGILADIDVASTMKQMVQISLEAQNRMDAVLTKEQKERSRGYGPGGMMR